MAWTPPPTYTAGAILTAAEMNDISGNFLQGHELVSTLPVSPTDGQTVYLQTTAMAAAGIVWTFRYRAAAGTYKWEFVGGPPWVAEIATGQAGGSQNAFIDLATVGPSITVPLAGEYTTIGTCRVFNNSPGANRCFIGVAIGAANPAFDTAEDQANNGHYSALSIVDLQTATAGAEFRLRYYQVNSSITFAYRSLTVTPRAVEA